MTPEELARKDDAAKLGLSILRLAKAIEINAPPAYIREEVRLLGLFSARVYGPSRPTDAADVKAIRERSKRRTRP
jgi:hypothetical protein